MESVVNKGSVFTVSLPVRHVAESTAVTEKLIGHGDAEAELDNIEANVSFDESKPIVLIIDDNRDIQKLVGELLSSH